MLFPIQHTVLVLLEKNETSYPPGGGARGRMSLRVIYVLINIARKSRTLMYSFPVGWGSSKGGSPSRTG